MLPAWATVAIALGASLITGAAAVLVASLTSRSERREQWRTRQLSAATDYAMRFIGAAYAVQYARAHPDDPDAIRNAVHYAGEVTPMLGPLLLVFGDGSLVADESRQAHAELTRAAQAVEGGDVVAAERALDDAHRHRMSFEAAVLTALRPA
jgi:hypothetical protein